MTTWDFAYAVGDEGGPYTALSDYTDAAYIISEGESPRRGTNPVIPYVDGEFSESFKFLGSGVHILSTQIAYTNPAGLVTHPDGEAGHAYENLSALKNLLGWGSRQRRVLRRTAPHQGPVELLTECLAGVEALEARYRFGFALRKLEGCWRAQTALTKNVPNISTFPHAFTLDVGGDYEVADPRFVFTCVADGAAPYVENTVNDERVTVLGSFVAGDVIVVDLASPRQFTLNGNRYAGVTSDRAWYIRLPYAQVVPMELGATSGTWTLDVTWRDKWL